ncbi:uncharacterized protein LOC135836739 [Planococcus citri]|uniref:uncharacterized protein LOC135836739 n=1 Tax=Planococcus citri TaxID=170843 RepID=UPI0031F9BD0D
MSSDDESFTTVRIVAKKMDQNVTYYLMEWADEIETGNSWFPAEDCPKVLIEEFEKGLKSTPPINNESVSVASRQLKDAGNREAEVISSSLTQSKPDISEMTNQAANSIDLSNGDMVCPSASRDNVDNDLDTIVISDSDSEDDDSRWLNYHAEDLEIVGCKPYDVGRIKLRVKHTKDGKTWFDSGKFGAVWPQLYIDFLEKHLTWQRVHKVKMY